MTRTIELSGTHRQVGRQHGEELREELREELDQRASRCLELSRRAGRETDLDGLRTLARECLEHVGRFSPDLAEEVEGIAEGAGVPPEDVLITSGYTDFKDVVSRGMPGDPCECTSLWAGPGATRDGSTYVAQTWDMFPQAQDGAVWMRLRVSGEPEIFVLSYAGCVGMMGMNSRGVALAANNLTPTDARPGVPWTFLNRAILASGGAEEAYAAMRRARLCSGHNFLIGDSSGAGFSVETTGTLLVRLDPSGPTYAHANHYLAPELGELEKRPLDPKGCSPQRAERMDVILREGRGKIDRAFVENALRDHQGRPRSICAHDYELSCGAKVRSCAALVMNATTREISHVTGNPCEGEFQTLKL